MSEQGPLRERAWASELIYGNRSEPGTSAGAGLRQRPPQDWARIGNFRGSSLEPVTSLRASLKQQHQYQMFMGSFQKPSPQGSGSSDKEEAERPLRARCGGWLQGTSFFQTKQGGDLHELIKLLVCSRSYHAEVTPNTSLTKAAEPPWKEQYSWMSVTDSNARLCSEGNGGTCACFNCA